MEPSAVVLPTAPCLKGGGSNPDYVFCPAATKQRITQVTNFIAPAAGAAVEHCATPQSRAGIELQLDDTLLLPAELTAAVLSERFQVAWEALVDRGQPSLALAFRALFFR